MLGPADTTTRPITDRVKQALFDRLAAADRLVGARVLDLFSGTGSMGLECLSRGCERVTFVETDRTALRRLEQNLRTLGHEDQANVLRRDALGPALAACLDEPLNLIFADPPYAMLQSEPSADRFWAQIGRLASVAAPEALLVVRSQKNTPVRDAEFWSPPTEHRYGSMTLHFYQKP